VTVTAPSLASGPAALPARQSAPLALGVAIAGGTIKVRRTAPIRLTCPAGASCSGDLALRSVKPAHVLGHARYVLKPGTTATVNVKLTRRLSGRVRVIASTAGRSQALTLAAASRRGFRADPRPR
jgi:hypothetical protein